MKTIKFTDLELESMIEMYNAELEEAEIYIAHIQEILKKLGVEPEKAEVVEKPKGKKRGPKPSVKPVEAKGPPKKRGRKPKLVLPTLPEVTVPEATPVVEVKVKTEPRKKVAKVKTEPKKIAAKKKVVAEKKPVVKPEPKKKPEAKVAAKVESVVTSLLNQEPKKVVKKVAKKKSTEKQRLDEMAASAKISKPATKKVAKAKPVVEAPPVAPIPV